jgi:GTP-dependent phosphoenolpyruvate carboxykinase
MASPQSWDDRAPIDKQAATTLPELAGWVGEIAGLAKPDAVVWCDGSQAEWDRLTSLLVENGTFTRLNPELRPNSFWCRSDPGDVARVEDRTFICSERKDAAGRFAWPGFGENIRVLKWIIQRLDGQAEAVSTPIGLLPAPGSLDLDGLDVSWADLALLLTVDTQAWKLEAEHIPEFFRTFHRHLPDRLWQLHRELARRLEAASSAGRQGHRG